MTTRRQSHTIASVLIKKTRGATVPSTYIHTLMSLQEINDRLSRIEAALGISQPKDLGPWSLERSDMDEFHSVTFHRDGGQMTVVSLLRFYGERNYQPCTETMTVDRARQVYKSLRQQGLQPSGNHLQIPQYTWDISPEEQAEIDKYCKDARFTSQPEPEHPWPLDLETSQIPDQEPRSAMPTSPRVASPEPKASRTQDLEPQDLEPQEPKLAMPSTPRVAKSKETKTSQPKTIASQVVQGFRVRHLEPKVRAALVAEVGSRVTDGKRVGTVKETGDRGVKVLWDGGVRGKWFSEGIWLA